MKKTLIILFFIGSIFQLKAQEAGATLPSVVPESPNAAAFAQYSDTPVGLHTGIPNISLPLYNIKSGEIELPITLSYHASGIKVAQEASWVGLGWALNTGGMISREVRGIDDFFYNGNGFPYTEEYDENAHSIIHNRTRLIEVAQGIIDTEADIYHYNFLGYSGKLIIEKQTGTILKATSLQQNNLVFLYVGNGWEVTDEKGWKYFFKTKEITGSYSGVYPINSYPENSWLPAYTGRDYDSVSAWYIDRILTPSGDEITFEYENDLHQTQTQVRISETYSHPNPGGEFGLLGDAIDVYSYGGSMQRTNDVYLQKIKFKNGYIDFTTKERFDMKGINQNLPPQCLDFFEVHNDNHKLIKKVDFLYAYFNQDSNDPEFMRLRLDAVQEKNSTTTIPPHQFTYNTIDLPSKKSLSIDHWGYYNGANNNAVNFKVSKLIDFDNLTPGGNGISINGAPRTSRIIKTLVPDLSIKLSSTYNFTGANRESDEIKMQAGILKSIQYPTGGITNFTYEPHDYSDPDNPYYKEIGNDIITQVWFAPQGHPLKDNFNTEEQLYFAEETEVTIDFVFEHLGLNNEGLDESIKPDGNNPIYINDMTILIEKINGDRLLNFIPDENGVNGQSKTIQVTFPPGQYILRVENHGQQNNILGIKTNYRPRVIDNAKIGGGIRIQSIETITPDKIAKKKMYEYDNNGVSNGRMLLNNRYWHLYVAYSSSTYWDPIAEKHVTFYTPHELLDRTSSSLLSQNASIQGSPVAYNSVKVSDVSVHGIKLGETKSFFDNTYFHRDSFSNPYFIPGIPIMMPNENGQLRREEVYNNEGTLVYKKEIDYALYPVGEINPNTNRPKNFIKSVAKYFPTPFGSIRPSLENIENDIIGRFIDYYNRYEWRYPYFEKTTTYDENGNNPVITSSNYYYENVNHKMVTKIITKNSREETIISNMEYPSDYPSGTGISTSTLNKMVEQNIISPVIKQNSTLNNAPISTQINVYKNWDVDNDNAVDDEDDILLPEIIKSIKGEESAENPLQDKIVFQEYTINGKVKKVKKADGNYIYYIWGYDNEYPIAKIENLGLSTISPLIINDLKTKSNEDNDRTVDNHNGGNIQHQGNEGLLRAELNNLRSSLPNALVTTYTYDPLIGVTSITDPRGYTIYYLYDKLNRLKEIRDENNNIVTDYQYHYKGQQ